MRTRDEQKEKLVIEKAIDLIVNDGFQGFSMGKLAKACNISAATLYIYYADKDDLLKKIGTTIGVNFFNTTLKDFSANMRFEEGLKKQWENRAEFALQFPKEVAFFEIIRHSPYGEEMMQESLAGFKQTMSDFFTNAINRKELISLPVEVFWSIAYGPLYSLLRFHREGKSMGGKPFSFNKQMMNETFAVVIKALTP
jgi:TetR/AcrR family transcriptional repressor of multidrug resistance operon